MISRAIANNCPNECSSRELVWVQHRLWSCFEGGGYDGGDGDGADGAWNRVCSNYSCGSCGTYDVVCEDNVSTLHVYTSSIHFESGFCLSFLADPSLGECGVLRVQLSCDCSGPLFGLLVWSDDYGLLRSQVLACVSAEEVHC